MERAHGVPVWIAPGRCISKHHDFWSAFDLVGISQDTIRFVQVTISEKNLKAKRDLIDNLEEYLPRMTGVSYELWHWRGRDGWRRWIRYGGPSKWREVSPL